MIDISVKFLGHFLQSLCEFQLIWRLFVWFSFGLRQWLSVRAVWYPGWISKLMYNYSRFMITETFTTSHIRLQFYRHRNVACKWSPHSEIVLSHCLCNRLTRLQMKIYTTWKWLESASWHHHHHQQHLNAGIIDMNVIYSLSHHCGCAIQYIDGYGYGYGVFRQLAIPCLSFFKQHTIVGLVCVRSVCV